MSLEQTSIRLATELLKESLVSHLRSQSRIMRLGDLCRELGVDHRYYSDRDVLLGALVSLRSEGRVRRAGNGWTLT